MKLLSKPKFALQLTPVSDPLSKLQFGWLQGIKFEWLLMQKFDQVLALQILQV